VFSISTVHLREREVIALARAEGLGLELQGFAYPENYGTDYGARMAGELAAAGASARSVHGPFYDLIPPSVDPELSALARGRFEGAVRDCAALGAAKLVLHTGWFPRSYGAKAWIERSAAFWRGFLEGKDASLRVHVENVYEEDWALIGAIVDAVADPRLSACLDLGHVNANSSASAGDWIRGLGPRIGHAHLHNNSGRGDEHLGLLDGSLDMEEALGLLAEHSPRATWNIESKLDFGPSVAFLKSFYARQGLGPDFG
jgi:sugar phosphate isomerase/epimerase